VAGSRIKGDLIAVNPTNFAQGLRGVASIAIIYHWHRKHHRLGSRPCLIPAWSIRTLSGALWAREFCCSFSFYRSIFIPLQQRPMLLKNAAASMANVPKWEWLQSRSTGHHRCDRFSTSLSSFSYLHT